MKLRIHKIVLLLTAGVLCIFMPAGCQTANPASESASDGAEQSASDSSKKENHSKTVGTFDTTDIHETSYTEKIFEDYDLTMVNVFATWCPPCVQELPELEKLYHEMKDQGVNVVGIVMDTVNESGNLDKEAIEKAKELESRSGITYPLLIPDSSNLNGLLNGVEAYPTTFFVDKNGSITGETYEGSSDLEGWRETVNIELASLKGDKQE